MTGNTLPGLADGPATGIFDLGADAYHADSLPGQDDAEPSLSASIAALMCQRSPLHAWTAHPRLNPGHQREEKAAFDLGTTVHALLLQGTDICSVIDADSWRTKAAKEAADEARAGGRIPLLAKDWQRVQNMVGAVRQQLEALDVDPPLLTNGKAEQTLVWREDGVTCRARLDWLHDDHRTVDDVKTTGVSANPRDWTRRLLWDIGADVQACMYKRAVRALTGHDPAFRFIVCETKPPYALSVIGLAPSILAHANVKVDWALAKWRECLDTGKWPAYPTEVVYADLSPFEETRWAEARWEDEQLRERTAA